MSEWSTNHRTKKPFRYHHRYENVVPTDRRVKPSAGGTFKWVKAKEINTRTAFNVFPMNESVVEGYVERLKHGKRVRPPLVHVVNGRLQIVDGRHRLEAMKRLGFKRIVVEVLP